ncbi:MAG: ribosomal protein S18-alanine N-acetyltransferase [Vicinamibacterales bacterium]
MTTADSSAARLGIIEPMQLERDLPGIHEVDLASFTNPWTPDMFRAEARSDIARVYVYRVSTGQIIGYCAVWFVVDEMHINNLAVLPEWRHQGAATSLLAHAFQQARRAGAVRATLEVRASNAPARRLYGKVGFRESGVRKGYYTSPGEDAVILWCDLAASSDES